MRVYLASPFFNETELKHVQDVEKALSTHSVFSPRKNQLDGLEFGSFEWRTNVYRNDINHIHWCDIVVAIIEDNYDDTGTAFEIGYAHHLGKPILLYNPTGNIINLMITDSLHAYFEDVKELELYDFDALPPKPYMKDVE